MLHSEATFNTTVGQGKENPFQTPKVAAALDLPFWTTQRKNEMSCGGSWRSDVTSSRMKKRSKEQR